MKFIDISGNRYGFLTVLERAGTYISPGGAKTVLWKCRCDCGNEKILPKSSLVYGSSKSCGCYRSSARNMTYDFEKDYVICHCKGGDFYVDYSDYEKIVLNNGWHIQKSGYVSRNSDKKTLHSLIMGKKEGFVIDHINRNKLDNRKKNLRFITYSANGINKTIKAGKSGEPHISYNTSNGYYCVYICRKYYGCSKNLDEAIRIRNNAIIETDYMKYSYDYL